MSALHAEMSAFERRKKSERAEAHQLAACQLAGGIDLAKALESGPAERQILLAKLARLIERERLRGMRRHWSYDLNRHIALKQAIDRLRACATPPAHGAPPTRRGEGESWNAALMPPSPL